MKLIIDIPKNFTSHYCFDKFDDSLKRIREDIHNHFFKCQSSISGNYELELLDMLDQAFKDSVVYNEKNRWLDDGKPGNDNNNGGDNPGDGTIPDGNNK